MKYYNMLDGPLESHQGQGKDEMLIVFNEPVSSN